MAILGSSFAKFRYLAAVGTHPLSSDAHGGRSRLPSRDVAVTPEIRAGFARLISEVVAPV